MKEVSLESEWTVLLFVTLSLLKLPNRDLKIQRRGRHRERQKNKQTKGLISKTTALHVHHAFLYISFLFLHDVKMRNFASLGGRKQATTKFNFSF